MLEYFKNRAKNFNQGKVNIREEDWKASTITASMSSCDISDNFVRGVLNQNGDLRETEKSNCIDANYHKGMDNHSQRTMIHETGCIKFGRTDEAKEVRKKNMSKGKDTTPFQMKEIKDVADGNECVKGILSALQTLLLKQRDLLELSEELLIRLLCICPIL
jgi:hypothetical protein